MRWHLFFNYIFIFIPEGKKSSQCCCTTKTLQHFAVREKSAAGIFIAGSVIKTRLSDSAERFNDGLSCVKNEGGDERKPPAAHTESTSALFVAYSSRILLYPTPNTTRLSTGALTDVRDGALYIPHAGLLPRP